MLYVIVGKKRRGKDTVAGIIERALEADVYQLADPIKESLGNAACQEIDLGVEDFHGNGVDRDMDLELENSEVANIFKYAIHDLIDCDYDFSMYDCRRSVFEKRIDEVCNAHTGTWTIRKMMQVFGTDVGVHVDKLIWVRPAISVYLQGIMCYNDLIITDCRQVHEILVFRELGAKIIHVERPEMDCVEDSHITELGLPKLEGESVIINDGTLEQLKTKVLNILKVN